MRILYHHRTQGRGAEGVHIASIVRALEELGHEVDVLSPPGVDPLATAGAAPLDKSETPARGIHVLWKFVSRRLPNFVFEILEVGYNLPAAWRLYAVLRRKRYDLVYERYAFFLVAGALVCSYLRVPLILEANEVSGIPDRARRQSFGRICAWFEHRIFSRCAGILTVSSYLRGLIERHGIENLHVEVVPNAVDPAKFAESPDTAALVARFRLEGKRVVGFAGWFDHWDRLDLLVEVFADLSARYRDLVLLLIGDGAVLESVRGLIRERGLDNAVVLTGPVARDEILAHLALLDIAVITHSNEFGSPVVMFEFMGLEIPIVAPGLPPILDVLEDRVHALLFDVLDMAQLKSCLVELLERESLGLELARNAHRLLLERHTWRSNAQAILQCLPEK